MPPCLDKIVAEVVRVLLDAYYDVRFSDRSHGFRTGRGRHTALNEAFTMAVPVARLWTIGGPAHAGLRLCGALLSVSGGR